MAVSIFSGYTDPLASLARDQTGQSSQLAQYAILQAARFMQSGRMEDALKEFQKASGIDPLNATSLTYIGNINLSLGNNGEAIKAFKRLVGLDTNSADAHSKLANAYFQDKQYKESETEFKTAAKLDPRNPVADYTLGIQYQMTGRLQEAETQFLKVQKVAPGDGNVYYSLGALYNQQGRYDEAVRNLSTALSLKPNFPAANYELGIAYSSLGEVDKARAQLDTLVNLRSPMAQDLNLALNKPKLLAMDTRTGNYNAFLGPRTPVYFLDASLTASKASKVFSMSFQFSTDMDYASVTDPANWTISQADGGEAGYYNDMVPVSLREAMIAPNPISVTYNYLTAQATISFRIFQNAAVNATIDPKHIVFKFSGQDALGRAMDTSSDEIDGYAGTSF